MLTIRAGLDGDGPALASLIAGVFAEYEGCPFVLAEFPELAAPATHYAAHGGWLTVVTDADAGGRLVGSFAVSRVDGSERFELHKVYLAASHRGRGLAGRLWQDALARIRSEGGRSIRLWTDTRFESGHRFYEAKGFRRLAVTRYLADTTHAFEYAYLMDPLS